MNIENLKSFKIEGDRNSIHVLLKKYGIIESIDEIKLFVEKHIEENIDTNGEIPMETIENITAFSLKTLNNKINSITDEQDRKNAQLIIANACYKIFLGYIIPKFNTKICEITQTIRHTLEKIPKLMLNDNIQIEFALLLLRELEIFAAASHNHHQILSPKTPIQPPLQNTVQQPKPIVQYSWKSPIPLHDFLYEVELLNWFNDNKKTLYILFNNPPLDLEILCNPHKKLHIAYFFHLLNYKGYISTTVGKGHFQIATTHLILPNGKKFGKRYFSKSIHAIQTNQEKYTSIVTDVKQFFIFVERKYLNPPLNKE